MRTSLIFVVGLLLAFPVHSSTRVNYCTVSKATEELRSKLDAEANDRAELQLVLLDRFEELMSSRKWEEGKPVGEQMTVAELEEFTQLQVKLTNFQFISLIESKRHRDLRAINRMTELSRMYMEGYLTESHVLKLEEEDKRILTVLAMLENAIDQGSLDPQTLDDFGEDCDVVNALRQEALQVASSLDQDLIRQVASELRRLKLEFKVLDKTVMDEESYQYYIRDLKPAYIRLMDTYSHVHNLQRLVVMEETSQLMLKALQRDHYISPADPEYSGTTWQSWLESGKVSDLQNTISGINQHAQ